MNCLGRKWHDCRVEPTYTDAPKNTFSKSGKEKLDAETAKEIQLLPGELGRMRERRQ